MCLELNIGKYKKKKKGPILVAAQSEAWVCGRSPAEIVGLNPAGAVAVSCECCRQVEFSATGSSRGVLWLCVCVCRKRPDQKKKTSSFNHADHSFTI